MHKEDTLQLECCTFELHDGEKEPLHWHGNIEIIYVESGCIRLAIRKRSYDVKMGEFAFINSCDHHAYHKGYTLDKTVLKIFSFNPVVVSSVSKLRLNVSYIAQNEDIDKLNIRPFINNAMDGLYSEYNSQGEYSDALMGAYITQLMLNLQKTYAEKEDLGTTVNVEYEHLFNNFMYNYSKTTVSEKTMGKFQLILDYLEKNFNDSSITLTRLSEISSLSECYISELFSLVMGIKFKQYLNTLRINYALQLLSMSDVTISGAAYESGFETIRTFNSAFKRLKGVTPSEYLDGVKGKETETGIVTSIKHLRAVDDDGGISYFPGGCNIIITDDPEGKRGKVFGMYCNTKNKTWTTFNVGMLFKAGRSYKISFDAYHLDDANCNACERNTIGINMFYPESDGESKAHSGGSISTSTGDGWVHCECVMTVSEGYIPGLFDKFSIFGNPKNDVGVNFLLDDISCIAL